MNSPHTSQSAAQNTTSSNPSQSGLTDSSIEPYRSAAQSFSPPTTLEPNSPTVSQPESSSVYTIPTDTLSPQQVPFNSAGLQWRSWRSKFSTIASLYVLAARHHEPTHASRRALHAVLSPPQDELNTPAEVVEWRRKATDIAQQQGIRGGVSAFHGYRIRQDTVDEFESQLVDTKYDDTATDVLLWEWIRQDDPQKHLKWGPHFHIIGLAHPDEDAIQDHTGPGILRCLREFPEYNRSMPTSAVTEHRAVSKDIIDHLTFDPSDPAPPLSWFGELRGNKWWSADQRATDETISQLRDQLINGAVTTSD